MSKATWWKVLSIAVVLVLVAGVYAADEKTLKGKITCAKCELKVDGQKQCHTVIVVKEKDKDVTYWFDADGSKKHHKEICQEGKKGSATGELGEMDKKKTIKVSKVEFDK